MATNLQLNTPFIDTPIPITDDLSLTVATGVNANAEGVLHFRLIRENPGRNAACAMACCLTVGAVALLFFSRSLTHFSLLSG